MRRPHDPNTEAPVGLPRRSFLARVAAGLSGVCAGALLTGFSTPKRGQMYGPVRQDAAILKRPRADDAAGLLGRYAGGDVIERSWAVGHITRGDEGQLCVVLVDGETTGHAEFELWQRGASDHGAVATTGRFAIHLPGPEGALPPHLERVGARLAAIVRRHEGAVRLQTPLPQRTPRGLA